MTRSGVTCCFVLLLGVLAIGPALAATYTVTVANDSGAGSLRTAIDNANSNAGADNIVFNAGLSGQTIHVQTDLPSFTDNGTSINGDTNADGKPNIAISGDQASINSGLSVNAANVTITGLCINSCSTGISVNGISADHCTIVSCYLGTNLAGNAPLPNDSYGLYLSYCPNATIGGTTATTRNVISGNYSYGIYMSKARNASIRGLFCGLNAAGNARMGNQSNGIYASNCANLTIGAEVASALTVFSGNYSTGLNLNYCAGMKIVHTYLGTNSTATGAIGNMGHGLSLYGCNNATVGGTGTLSGNVLSGNTSSGLYASNGFGGPLVQGNKIGTNLAGGARVPNLSYGVYLYACDGATLGGTTTAARNLISGNAGAGAYLNYCTNTNVRGNFIGTSSTGNVVMRNLGDGVSVVDCQNVDVGGGTASARNVIASRYSGVRVNGVSCANVDVLMNYIGYGANGTTQMPGSGGVDVGGQVRNVNVGLTGKGNRILSTGRGVNLSEAGTGIQVIQNRIGAPVGTTAQGSHGVQVEHCAPLLDGNTVLQQSNCGMWLYGQATTPIIKNNTIRRCSEGVSINERAKPNLGDLGNVATDDNGNNTFVGNSDFDIANYSTQPIKAEGNTFATTNGETIDGRLIYDQVDSPGLGRVDFAPLKSGAPTISGQVVAMTLSAAGTRNGGAQIVVNLTAAGQLETQVLNMAGRSVRVWPEVAGTAGVNTLLWDGRSSSGVAVPNGLYLVQVTCRAPNGAQQRQMARVSVGR